MTTALLGPTATAAQLVALMADMTVDRIEMAGILNGRPSFNWDNVKIDGIDRTARHLTVAPYPGDSLNFIGNGTVGDGIFSFGRSSTPKWITFDGVKPDGFIFNNIALAASGVIGVNGTDHLTLRMMTFRNISRDPAYNGAPHFSTPYKSWLLYGTSETGRANNDLTIQHWYGEMPKTRRDVSGLQMYNGTQMNTNVTFEDIFLTGYYYAMFIGEDITNFQCRRHNIIDCGNGTTPTSWRISNGVDPSVFVSGSYSSIHGYQSDGIFKNNTGGGTFTDAGGNTFTARAGFMASTFGFSSSFSSSGVSAGGTMASSFPFSTALAGQVSMSGIMGSTFGFGSQMAGTVAATGTMGSSFGFGSQIAGVVSNLGSMASTFTFSTDIEGFIPLFVNGDIASSFGFSTAMSGTVTNIQTPVTGTIDSTFTWGSSLPGAVGARGTMDSTFTWSSQMDGIGGLPSGVVASVFGWGSDIEGTVTDIEVILQKIIDAFFKRPGIWFD